MSSFFERHNPSVLAIPAFYYLSHIPRGLSVYLATNGQMAKWENKSPRGTEQKERLKKSLTSRKYAQYERLDACHANSMENLSFFAAAVILGNMAELRPQYMAGFVTWFLTFRTAYIAAYALIERQEFTIIRSILFHAASLSCVVTLVKAAEALGGRL